MVSANEDFIVIYLSCARNEQNGQGKPNACNVIGYRAIFRGAASSLELLLDVDRGSCAGLARGYAGPSKRKT